MAEITSDLIKAKMDIDAAVWAQYVKLKLANGQIFSFEDRPYLVEPMSTHHKVQMSMKATGGGFPIDIATPVPTVGGWTTMEEIKTGERVFGTDGRPYTVTEVHSIKYNQDCYRVTFNDSSSIVCDGDHLWTLTDMWHYRYVKNVTITTRGIRAAKKRGSRNRYVLDVPKPLEFPEARLPVHPYILGLWLGDGNSYSAQITCGPGDCEEYSETLKNIGVDFEVRVKQCTGGMPKGEYRNIKLNNMSGKLRQIGVMQNKHIPIVYRRASVEQRLELLRGLMDTDGHITKSGKCEFYNINTILLAHVKELIHSLGMKAVLSAKQYSSNWNRTQYYLRKIYRISFKAYSDMPIAKLSRKAKNQRDRAAGHPTITERRRIVKVEPVESVPVRCITVDSSDHLFLAGEDFIPVHNSECQGILPTLHGMIKGRYPQGVLYLFPTNDDVQDYSKSRFGPLFLNNQFAIGKYVKSGGARGTDTSKLKIVNGKNLYLRGARLDPGDEGAGAKTSTKLSGIQVDRVVFDEVDLIDPEAIPLALGRCGNASVDGIKGNKEVVYIANPSDEDRGIDILWQKSDQRYWFRKCNACNEYTCAELEFQNDPHKCVGIDENGKGYIRCRKCGLPIGLAGVWRPKKPENSDLAGYHWSHLSSNYCDPAQILSDFTSPPDNNLGAVYRYQLGLPYSSKEDKLRKQDVLACCSRDIMPDKHEGPCAMGVDVGKVWHVVIGTRIDNERYEILKVAQVNDLNDIHDLAQRYNVKSAVIDIRPYEDSVRKFQKAEPYKIFLCEYTDSPLQDAAFNDNNGIVKTFRTGIFDSSHKAIMNSHIRLPRQCPAIEEFAQQVCNCVKTRDERRKDVIIYRYVPTGSGQDHYRNALNYFLLAAGKVRKVSRMTSYGPAEEKFVLNETDRYI